MVNLCHSVLLIMKIKSLLCASIFLVNYLHATDYPPPMATKIANTTVLLPISGTIPEANMTKTPSAESTFVGGAMTALISVVVLSGLVTAFHFLPEENEPSCCAKILFSALPGIGFFVGTLCECIAGGIIASKAAEHASFSNFEIGVVTYLSGFGVAFLSLLGLQKEGTVLRVAQGAGVLGFTCSMVGSVIPICVYFGR